MSNKKISITAIIFVILYFSFAVFISLFKGLTFHDLKFNNIHIKKLFVKIHKKIILEANSITIIPQQKISKDIINIHKKVYYLSKIDKIFEKLKFENIKYQELKIPLILFSDKKIIIKSNILNLNGKIYTFKNYTILQNLNLNYRNYIFDNINGSIKYQNSIIFKLQGIYNTGKIDLQGELTPKDILNVSLSSKKINININNIPIKLNNLKLSSQIDLRYKNFNSNVIINNLIANYKYSKIALKDINFSLNKNKIKFTIDQITLNKYDKVKNLVIDYLKGTYFIKSNLLIIPFNKKVSFYYEDKYINLYKNNLIYKNIDNLNLHTDKITLKYKNFLIKSNNGKFLKFEDFIYFEISDNTLKNSLLRIYNDIIYGYNKRIEIPLIKGTYKNIKFNFLYTLINISLKKAVIASININDIIFSPTFIKYKNDLLNISTYTNNLKFDKRLKTLLKEFNITLPIMQLRGENYLKGNINYFIKNKKISWDLDINSTNGIYKYENYTFSYENLISKIKDFNSTTKIKKFYLPTDFGKLIADANVSTTKTYLNAFTKIKHMNIYNLVKIQDYKEKIIIDFIQNIIYFLNSQIYIDLNNNKIFFLSLKRIIDFTVFNDLIQDGGIYVKIDKNILLKGNLILKKPLIMNQRNPYLLDAVIQILPKDILISNQYIYSQIHNYEKINVNVRNLDINTKTLIYIYDKMTKLFSKHSNSESNLSVKIESKNTNFIYDSHKFLSEYANVQYKNNLHIYSKYKNSFLEGYTKKGYFLMEGKHYEKEELVALLDFFNNFKNINLDFIFVKSPDNFYTGKIYINSGIVKKLTVLNNIIAFLNTIPSLLSLNTPGFSAKGYKIKKGYVDYLFYKNILYFKQLKITGINLDFIGKGYIDFNTQKIYLKITAIMKMKYKKIPIVGKGLSYILFGKDGNIDVKILVKGNLENPKVTQDIGKSILLTPFQLFKRAITLPFNLF